MWAMVIDLLDEYRVSHAEIENIIKQNTDGIFNGSATRKAAFDFLNDPLNRKKFIASESKHHLCRRLGIRADISDALLIRQDGRNNRIVNALAPRWRVILY